ncbi:MAG: hypothetical protein KDA50_06260 [Rhodobacteraceae bacterium]|nr:hypothetical protein [Paracoccaceae bacterium]
MLLPLILDAPLDPDSPLSLMIRHWGPPLISILVGGLFASVLFPRWQESWTRTRARSQHGLEMTENLASSFSAYLTAWRRLIDIAGLQQERPLTEEEKARLLGFVADRNAARNTLLDLCARGQLYFSDAACDTITEFLDWDRKQAAKRLDDLPDLEEWRVWQKKIMRQLKADARSGR